MRGTGSSIALLPARVPPRRRRASLVALGVPSLWPRPGRAAGADPVVVAIFLRGAADGLSLVVPHGDPDYAALRPTIQLSPSDTLDLDGFYALHPSLAPLAAAIPERFTGHPARGRQSGPDAFALRSAGLHRDGGPRRAWVTSGWLNRCLASQSVAGAFAGVSIGSGKALA